MCARARWVERGVTITEKVKKHRWGSRYKFIDHPIYYIDYPINCIDYPINFLQSEHIIKNGGVYWTRCNIKHKYPKLVYLLKVRKTSDQIEINCAHFSLYFFKILVFLQRISKIQPHIFKIQRALYFRLYNITFSLYSEKLLYVVLLFSVQRSWKFAVF